MNRNHSCDWSVPFPVDWLTSFGIDLALPLKVLLQLARVQTVGALIDIHEIWSRVGLANGFRGRNKGVGHGDNHIAPPHSGRHQCKADRVSSTRNSNAVRRVAEKSEFALKLVNHRTANETSCFQHSLKNWDQFLLKSVVKADQVQKRNTSIV
jgi:hypothetical protein